MKKNRKDIFEIVPNTNADFNKMNKYLSVIEDTKVGCVKRMIFVTALSKEAKEKVLKYLNQNKNIFEYAT